MVAFTIIQTCSQVLKVQGQIQALMGRSPSGCLHYANKFLSLSVSNKSLTLVQLEFQVWYMVANPNPETWPQPYDRNPRHAMSVSYSLAVEFFTRC